jgi:hypothetical protein
MSFPWPAIQADQILDEALDITMRYFDLPPGEEEYADIETLAGEAILEDWRRGVRNKSVLANKAIAEIEERHPLGKLRRGS